MARPRLTQGLVLTYQAAYRTALHDYEVAAAREAWQRGYVEELSRIPTRVPRADSPLRAELARRAELLADARDQLLVVIGLLRQVGLAAAAPWPEEERAA